MLQIDDSNIKLVLFWYKEYGKCVITVWYRYWGFQQPQYAGIAPEGVGVADDKIAEFEARYDAIVQTAAKEYEDEPPSDYYKDGYNLYLRMAAYKHNHLLFLSNPLVEPDNNLCERKARV